MTCCYRLYLTKNSKNTVRNATIILEAINRDVLSSDIWDKYIHIFDSYEYIYDGSTNYSINDDDRDVYDSGNIVRF